MILSFLALLTGFVSLSMAMEMAPSTSASPPNLSAVRPIDLLLHNAERKFGNKCYIVSYRICPRKVSPLSCMVDDTLEGRTKIKLDQLKFVYQESSFHTHIYRAAPQNPKKVKEKDLFNIPVNLFVFLREIPGCSRKSLTLPEYPLKENISPSHEQSLEDQAKQKLRDEELEEHYQHLSPEKRKEVIEAHKFLTDIPLHTKEKTYP